MSRNRLPALIALVCALCLTSCGFSHSFYLSHEGSERPTLRKMFADVKTAGNHPRHRFLYMQEIIKILRKTKHPRRLNLLLTDYVARHRTDPYDAYYLYVVAQDYLHAQAVPFADFYLRRVISGYPNLDVNGTSIDYISLSELVKLTPNPYRRISYYKEMLSRFSAHGRKAADLYALAQSYQQVGEWRNEVQAYENFLQQPNGTVPGKPNARQTATDFVNLYNYPDVTWAYSNLNELIARIRYAIELRSVGLLSHYWAKVGFFARSWESLDAWDRGARLLVPLFLRDFSVFMTPSVYVAPRLDVNSNSREAYLKTGGWSYRIPTWYLYFKKINFPANPKIQGKWEWAGIYFGHKLFTN